MFYFPFNIKLFIYEYKELFISNMKIHVIHVFFTQSNFSHRNSRIGIPIAANVSIYNTSMFRW